MTIDYKNKYQKNFFRIVDQIEPPQTMLEKFWSDTDKVFRLLCDYQVEIECEIELRKIADQNPIAMRLLEV